MNQNKPRRRWLRFTLRGFMIFVLLVCVWLARVVNQVHLQRQIWAELERSGGSPHFETDLDENGREVENPNELDEDPGLLDQLLGGLLGEVYYFPIAGADFPDSPPTTEALDLLARLPKVSALSFRATGIRIANLKKIKRLPGLRSLGISEANDAILKEISDLSDLRCLYVAGPELTNSGIRHIGRLKNLRELAIGGDNLTGVAFRSLVALKNLQDLHVSSTTLTRADLMDIARLKNLRGLSLEGFTADPDLAPLESLHNLRRLELRDHNVRWASLLPLRKSLPDLETITHRSNGRSVERRETPSERSRGLLQATRGVARKR